MSTPPHYAAPDESRQRVRLVAALGVLAAAALAVGGLITLMADEDPEPTPTRWIPDQQATAQPPSAAATIDSLDALVNRVEQAERATSAARESIRRARAIEAVGSDQLDWLERRLDALGAPGASAPIATPSAAEPPREL